MTTTAVNAGELVDSRICSPLTSEMLLVSGRRYAVRQAECDREEAEQENVLCPHSLWAL